MFDQNRISEPFTACLVNGANVDRFALSVRWLCGFVQSAEMVGTVWAQR